MQPITLTPEHHEFGAVVRQFAEAKIAPRPVGIDERGEFDWDAFADCVAMDLPGLGIPEEYGGSGADMIT